MQQRTTWLRALAKPSAPAGGGSLVPGLIAAVGADRSDLAPEQIAVLERAAAYGADYVFFRAATEAQPAAAEALIFIDDPLSDDAFAELHRRLWSWGGVPLILRKRRARVDLLRCAHRPDFIGEDGRPRYHAFDTLDLLTTLDLATAAPWWDPEQLYSGALWDDPERCAALLSADRGAARQLVQAIAELDAALDQSRLLPERLRRRLLVLSLLIAYLEDRGVLDPQLFGQCTPGAARFFEVLADGPGLVRLLTDLERRFNGDVFCMSEDEQAKLIASRQLARFAELVEGRTSAGGQLSLWRLYSFRDLPVELISHVYQHFVRADRSAVYTPPFLVRLMLDEALGAARLDRLEAAGEAILDPSCGSGVFLALAYKRLILHWRARNAWAHPSAETLRALLRRIRGVDLNPDAVELTAFSLCLALCEALDAPTLRAATKLFPKLGGRTLHTSCFFDAKRSGALGDDIGVIIGNPPFESKLATPGALASYERYQQLAGKLPDKQVAYLFLHESLELLRPGGLLCMLQQYNILYNLGAAPFRRRLFDSWDVREVLDLTSIRGLFGAADTKVLALLIEAQPPAPERPVLHATFRRSGRVVAEQGFDLDYYDLHWLPRAQICEDDAVWRGDLLGGGRVVDLVARLRALRTLSQYAHSRDWQVGQGFIRGGAGKSLPAEHLVGARYLPSTALTPAGLDKAQLSLVPDGPIERPRAPARFTPPMLLVRLHADLPHHLETEAYLTYPDQVVGIAAPRADLPELRRLDRFLKRESRVLQAYVAATSRKIQKATAIMQADIEALPYPPSGALDLSPNERLVADDVVDTYRDLIRLGEKSRAYAVCDDPTLGAFSEAFTRQVATIYPGLRPLAHQRWSGAICQPFLFGPGEAEWADADQLHQRVLHLLQSDPGPALRLRRIARIFDGRAILLLKPDRRRYWLPSIALRDADETLAELHAQGL
jgi:hypothetical protein